MLLPPRIVAWAAVKTRSGTWANAVLSRLVPTLRHFFLLFSSKPFLPPHAISSPAGSWSLRRAVSTFVPSTSPQSTPSVPGSGEILPTFQITASDVGPRAWPIGADWGRCFSSPTIPHDPFPPLHPYPPLHLSSPPAPPSPSVCSRCLPVCSPRPPARSQLSPLPGLCPNFSAAPAPLAPAASRPAPAPAPAPIPNPPRYVLGANWAAKLHVEICR